MATLSLHNIVKTYNKGETLALNNISFTVDRGEMFGLIGPDGAGKTTLFRILTTLLLPDKGSAMVGGYDVIKHYKAIRGIVGYMPGKFSLYQDLTVQENLQFFATVFDTTISENYDLIENIYQQLKPFKNRRAGKLSGGMKQKLALCCALIHKPQVLFLDEPTTGVDIVSRQEFWEMLKYLQKHQITLLIATSYMDEASKCDRIALMQNGKILSVASPKKLIDEYPEVLYAVKAEKLYPLLKDLRQFPELADCYSFGEYIHLLFKPNAAKPVSTLRHYLKEKGHQAVELINIEPTVEDCFIRLLKN